MIEASQSATFTNTPGHSRARLEQILNPTIDGRVAANVAGWEKKRFQLYEAITAKELGEEVKTAMFTKLALKNKSTPRRCPPKHVSRTQKRDRTFRSRYCAEPRRCSHGAGCNVPQWKGQARAWQKQWAQTVLGRTRRRSKATVKMANANTTKSEKLVHVIGAAEKGISWLTACQLHQRRPQKYKGRLWTTLDLGSSTGRGPMRLCAL